MLLEVGGGCCKNQHVRLFDGQVDVAVEMDATGVKVDSAQIQGIVSKTFEIVDLGRSAHVPVDLLGAIHQHDFGQGCCPAAATHDADFSLKFHDLRR